MWHGTAAATNRDGHRRRGFPAACARRCGRGRPLAARSAHRAGAATPKRCRKIEWARAVRAPPARAPPRAHRRSQRDPHPARRRVRDRAGPHRERRTPPNPARRRCAGRRGSPPSGRRPPRRGSTAQQRPVGRAVATAPPSPPDWWPARRPAGTSASHCAMWVPGPRRRPSCRTPHSLAPTPSQRQWCPRTATPTTPTPRPRGRNDAPRPPSPAQRQRPSRAPAARAPPRPRHPENPTRSDAIR